MVWQWRREHDFGAIGERPDGTLIIPPCWCRPDIYSYRTADGELGIFHAHSGGFAITAYAIEMKPPM